MGFVEELEELPVSCFHKTKKNNGEVIIINHNASVRIALHLLSENNVYSCPVWNDNEKQFIGVIDLIDIVEFIATNFDQIALGNSYRSSLIEQSSKLDETEVSAVVGISGQDLVPVPDNVKLPQVIQLLTDKQVHRVFVFSDSTTITNIITQSAIVEYLTTLDLADFGRATIKELNLGSSPVFTVDITEKTIAAFRTLRNQKIYAVAVCNQGILVATISAKDVRFICSSTDNFRLLYSPISEFLSDVRHSEVNIKNPSIVCKETDSISSILGKLVENRIHRIFVVDELSKPTKIITLTDIMKALAN